jgi:tetratricopeptide (TPR) repeat protein
MKKKPGNPLKIIVLLGIIFLTTTFIQPADQLPTGEIIESIRCRHTPGESYALYLPTNFNSKSDRKWPVLFAFDPGGSVKTPLELFKAAADKYNYILVCPANAKNGPWQPINNAIRKVWADVSLRLPIDKGRVYATGFSGGSRMASYVSKLVGNPVQGIIACGAGISPTIKLEDIKGTAYFGIVGFADFNYHEMTLLEEQMKKVGQTSIFHYYDAKHRWPPEPILTRAIQWLELNAMKQNLLPRDQSRMTELFNLEKEHLAQRESSGEFYYAAKEAEADAKIFKGLLSTDQINQLRAQAQRLKKTKDWKKFKKAEKRRLSEEHEKMTNYIQTAGYIKSSNPRDIPLSRLFIQLELKRLEKDADNQKNKYDSGLARRLLYAMGSRSYAEGGSYLLKKDYPRAEIFFQLAARTGKRTWFYSSALYNLAATYALEKETKKALKYLQESIDNGFTNVNHIENDNDLKNIRNTPQYKAIIKTLKENHKTQK